MQSKIRSLASDTIVYGVSTVLGRFLTFLLTPLYTNYLTASEIGDVAAIYAMIAFVGILYSLGLEPAFMRFWEPTNDERNSKVFNVAFVGVGVLAVVVTAVTIIAAPWLSTSSLLQLEGDGAAVVRIAAFIPFFDALILIPFARLRMQRQPRKFALYRLAAIIVNVALNGALVIAFDMHVEGVALAGALSSAFAFLLFMPTLGLGGMRRRSAERGSGKGAWDSQLMKEMLHFGLPTVPASFSSIMVQVIDRPLLLILTGSAVVGMYQTNFRLAIPMMMFITVFEYAWKPFYLSHREDPEAKALFARVMTLFTVVCGAIFLATSLYMPYIVQLPFIGGRFINPLYWSGMSIIPVIMFAYFFNGVFINMAAGLHITKKTGWLPVATGIAAVVNVGATLILVPLYHIDGAAWAKVAAYVAGAIALAIYVQKVYPMRYDLLRILATMAVTGLLYFVVMLIPDESSYRLYAVVAALPLYVLFLIAFRVLGTSSLRTLLSMVRR